MEKATEEATGCLCTNAAKTEPTQYWENKRRGKKWGRGVGEGGKEQKRKKRPACGTVTAKTTVDTHGLSLQSNLQ